MNKNKLELEGKIVSFKNNFNPSAIGCNKPKKPTTLGPRRRCIPPIIFRSANVKNATEIKTGTITAKICAIIIRVIIKISLYNIKLLTF